MDWSMYCRRLNRVLAFFSLFFLVVPRQTSAAGITEVTLTEAGPDQTLPLGSSFYLKGAAEGDVVAVAPLFIRYSRSVWGIPPRVTCGDIGKAISSFEVRDNVFDAKSTNVKVRDLWKPTRNTRGRDRAVFEDHSGDAVYRPAVWQRSKDDDKEFKILVGDPGFFKSGSRYCMLVYKKIKKAEKVAPKVKEVTEAYVKKVQACGASDLQAATVCVERANQAAVKAVMALTPGLPEEWIKTTLLPLSRATVQEQNDIKAAAGLLAKWVRPNIALPGESAAGSVQLGNPPTDTGYAKIDDPFAKIMARLLVREGVLFPALGRDGVDVKGKALSFYDDSGVIQVNYLGILDDWTGIRIREDLQIFVKEKQRSLKVDFSKIVVPGSQVTLLDLIHLAQRKIRVGSELVTVDNLYGDKMVAAFKKGDRAALQQALAALQKWNDLLSVSEQSGSALHGELWKWLHESALQTCESADFKKAIDDAPFYPQPPADKWRRPVRCDPNNKEAFGFAWDGDHPVGVLAARTSDYLRDTATLALVDEKAIKEKFEARQLSSSPLALRLDMSQNQFFTNYVTVFVGQARFLETHQEFATAYTGVQVYLFPNPIEEPMWSNGSIDFTRLASVELAIAPTTEQFGPGNRYSKPRNAPFPVFVGVALQPLPYVTASAGIAALGVRRTALPQESPQTIGTGYVGLSIQANVPDLIRRLAEGNSKTEGSK